MTETALITPRRNFLIRALGFTAGGAALSVPIVTMDSAERRFEHHLKGLGDAMRDLFPTQHIDVRGNCLTRQDAAFYQEVLPDPEDSHRIACVILTAGKYIDWSTRHD
jgi:hypothetical protein